ncbi:DUF6933 domain-containing protein [Marinilabilia sp.]
MIIRATKKALNLSRIRPEKKDADLTEIFPGEWYVDLISLGRPGKFGLQFVHHYTKITILLPGKSVNKVYSEFKKSIIDYLERHNHQSLVEKFELDSNPEIFTTNSKSVLAHMKEVKWNNEYHCAHTFRNPEEIDFKWLEDLYYLAPFKSKFIDNKYLCTKQILESVEA